MQDLPSNADNQRKPFSSGLGGFADIFASLPRPQGSLTVPFQATERNMAKTVSGGVLRLGVKRLGFPKIDTRGLLGNIDRGHSPERLEVNHLDSSRIGSDTFD